MDAPLTRRIRTVQYDDQRFTSTEVDLLHTPALQRLYDLHQLGLADRVFIDASHSRLHHVVGVVEQADRIMRAIVANLEKYPEDRLEYAGGPERGVTKREVAQHARKKVLAVRLMGMLHDLTHAPFGHTLEDEIELVGEKHDEPARQADAFYRLVLQYIGWIERNADPLPWGVESGARPADGENEALLSWYLDCPELNEPPETSEFVDFLAKRWVRLLKPRSEGGATLRRITSASLTRFLEDLAFAVRALLHLDLAHKEVKDVKSQHVPESEYPVDRLLSLLLQQAGVVVQEEAKFHPQRDVFLLDVIGNTICADLLDYARRDAANAGIRLDYDPQRIVDNMTVVVSAGPRPIKVDGKAGPVDFPFSDACLRTCVSLFSHKLRTDVPGELLNLLQVRYFVYERMLFHPTKCVAGAVLGAAIQFIGWKILPKHWRYVGDQVFLHDVAASARLVRDLLSAYPAPNRFDAELVQRLQGQIQALPVDGVRKAAVQLLADRLITFGEVAAHLEVTRRFQDQQSRSSLLLPILGPEPGETLNEETFGRIRDAIGKKSGQDKIAAAAVDWLRERIPTVGAVRDELKAGLRLLDRLAARRYLKITFRLLPNARVKGLHSEDAAKTAVAELFKKPLERKIAEREIERRVNLPAGSVVIHCPPVKGPKKIAKILISSSGKSSGTEPRVAMLNSIKSIDPDVFTKHQEAIKALEDMYASTWRFAVSVAPPHDANWRLINEKVGRVLLELLTGSRGEHETVDNDAYTVQEIEGIEAGISTAEKWEAREASGSDASQQAGERGLALRLGDALRKIDEFSALAEDATDAQIEEASRQFQSRIRSQGTRLAKGEGRGGKKSRPARTKDYVRQQIAEFLGLDHFENVTDPQLVGIMNRASLLDEDGWKAFLNSLSEFRPPTPIIFNSVSQDQRRKLFSDVDAVLTEIEGGLLKDDSTAE